MSVLDRISREAYDGHRVLLVRPDEVRWLAAEVSVRLAEHAPFGQLSPREVAGSIVTGRMTLCGVVVRVLL